MPDDEMEDVSDQLPLIRNERARPFKTEYVSIHDGRWPERETLVSPEPTAAIIQQIKAQGVMDPITVVVQEDGSWKVPDGKRRMKTLWILSEQAEAADREPEITDVRVDFYQAEDWAMSEVVTIAKNQLREDNPIADMIALDSMNSAGYTPRQIYVATGMNLSTQKSRLRLRDSIDPRLLIAVKSGGIAIGVAKSLTKTTKDQQEKLVEHYHTYGKLTGRDVDEITRVDATAATDELPGELFGDVPVSIIDTPTAGMPTSYIAASAVTMDESGVMEGVALTGDGTGLMRSVLELLNDISMEMANPSGRLSKATMSAVNELKAKIVAL